MTRFSCLVLASIALSACASAQRSRWTPNADTDTPYMICTCDGVERQPKPSEAADFSEHERVDLVCDGKVRDCHRGKMEKPGARNDRRTRALE